jgi:hypothetical protein
VAPDKVAALVEAAGVAVSTELENAGEEVAGWHPAEGEWCAKEVLGHLYETERRGFAGRIAEILSAPAGKEPVLKASGPLSPGYCDKPLAQLLDDFNAQRRTSVDYIRGLRGEGLIRAGIHERVGRITVSDLLHEWVHHDRAHIAQILANVQAYVWPEMGNTQKFSG